MRTATPLFDHGHKPAKNVHQPSASSSRVKAALCQAARILLTAGLIAVVTTGCARKFAFSINDNVLYDPRPGAGIRVADPGLQSCINLAIQQSEDKDPRSVTILTCPSLEIATLEGITVLENLRYLDLANNEIRNFDPLIRLDHLSSLNAPDNLLQDIGGILSISSLTSAVLTGNPRIPCDQLDSLEERLGKSLRRPASCFRT